MSPIRVDAFAKCVVDGAWSKSVVTNFGCDVGLYQNTAIWAGSNRPYHWIIDGDDAIRICIKGRMGGTSTYDILSTSTYPLDTIPYMKFDTRASIAAGYMPDSFMVTIGIRYGTGGDAYPTYFDLNLSVGAYLSINATSNRYIHILMDKPIYLANIPPAINISGILIYAGLSTQILTYDILHSPIACGSDLMDFSEVSSVFDSISNPTRVLIPSIITDTYGIPSFAALVGLKSISSSIKEYYILLNSTIPTKLYSNQGIRYTDLQNQITSITTRAPARVGHTITWNSNGGQYQSETTSKCIPGMTIGSGLDGFMPYACKNGYYFTGWYTDPTGGTQISSSTVPEGNVTYYAHYSDTSLAARHNITCDISGHVYKEQDIAAHRS